jgi:hypothetical protein
MENLTAGKWIVRRYSVTIRYRPNQAIVVVDVRTIRVASTTQHIQIIIIITIIIIMQLESHAFTINTFMQMIKRLSSNNCNPKIVQHVLRAR